MSELNDNYVKLSSRIQIRRDTASNWELIDTQMEGGIVLLNGEIGYEVDTGRVKIGDGTKKWMDLEYAFLGLPKGTKDSLTDDTILKAIKSVPQTLSEAEKAQARQNINASAPDGYYGNEGGVFQYSTNFLGKNAPTTAKDLVFRPTASQMSGQAWTADSIGGQTATIDKIKGKTLVWNQLVQNGNFESTSGWSAVRGNIAVNNNICNYTISQISGGDLESHRITRYLSYVSGHKYLFTMKIKAPKTTLGNISCSSAGISYNWGGISIPANNQTIVSRIGTSTDTGNFITSFSFGGYTGGFEVGDIIEFSNCMIIDLTQMFGAGKEPATVEEFKAMFPLDYYAYNAGELISFNGTGLKTNGFNQWDEEIEAGSIDNTTGELVVFPTLRRCKNAFKVFPNTRYKFTIARNRAVLVYWYDPNMQYIGYVDNVYGSSSALLSPPNAGYARIRLFSNFTDYSVGDICINISWSGIRNGEYEPYWDSTLVLPIADYFEDGMKSVGNVFDELQKDKYVKRIGKVDLGSIDTSLITDYTSATYPRFQINISGYGVKEGLPSAPANILMADYITDSTGNLYSGAHPTMAIGLNGTQLWIYNTNCSNATQLHNQLSGKVLYYELATPIETPITPELNLIYRCDDFGTEMLLPQNDDEPVTAPMDADIVYQIDYEAQIRNNDSLNITKESMDNFISSFNASNIGTITQTWDATNKRYTYSIVAGTPDVEIINITSQNTTLGNLNTMLTDINNSGRHVFFDVSALGASMYLCTIYIDSSIYRIFDLVSGRYIEGSYDASKLLTMCLVSAESVATQSQIDHLQTEIDELGGKEVIKDWDALGTLIESGTSTDTISPGDTIDLNWIKSVLGTTTHGLTVTCTDMDKFINGVGEADPKDYYFVYNGTAWTYNETPIVLADWGLSVTGTPQTGEIMTITTTVDPVNYTFVGYDKSVPADSAVPHVWTIEQTYAPTTKAYDNYESLFNLAQGATLPAGKYKITKPYYASSPMITVYFTTTKAYTATNDILQFASTGYQSVACIPGVETKYYIASAVKPSYIDTNTYTDSAAISILYNQTGDDWVDLSTVEGVTIAPCQVQAALGNNCPAHCNLRQWLNDDSVSGHYEHTNEFDRPSTYNFTKGFLWGLDPRVKQLMIPCKNKFVAGYQNEGYTQGTTYEVTDTVFLLSMKEMSFNIQTTEGDAMDLYSEYTGNILTNDAVAARAKYNKAGGTLNSYRWSRSALSSVASGSRLVASSGSYDNGYAFSGYYVAPACAIGKRSSNTQSNETGN